MFDKDIQDEFAYSGVMDNGKATDSVDYEKAWEYCLIEVCSKVMSENVMITSQKRKVKMAAKIKELRENGIDI